MNHLNFMNKNPIDTLTISLYNNIAVVRAASGGSYAKATQLHLVERAASGGSFTQVTRLQSKTP